MLKISIFITLLFIVATTSYGNWIGSNYRLIKGNLEYKNENYDLAIQNYIESSKGIKRKYVSYYNLANAYYKLENYTRAIEFYRLALQESKKNKKGYIYYNMGNSYYKLSEYKKAAESYIKALDFLPYNKNAKQNLELTLKKLKEQKRYTHQVQKDRLKHGSKTIDKSRKYNQGSKNDKSKSTTLNERFQQDTEFLTPKEAERLFKSLEKFHRNQIEKIIKDMLKDNKDTSNDIGW